VKFLIAFSLLSIVSFNLLADEVGTGEGNGNPESYACYQAKLDAQRQARNNSSVITGYDSCNCEYNSGFDSFYCTVDFSMRSK
jgi:hypothetical protein